MRQDANPPDSAESSDRVVPGDEWRKNLEPLNRRYERKRISIICLGIAVLIVTANLAGSLFGFLAGSVDPSFFTTTEGTAWITAAGQYLVAFPLCAVMISKIPPDPMEKGRMNRFALPKLFVVCCAMMTLGALAGFAVNYGVTLLVGKTPDNYVNSMISETSLLYNVLTVGILAPIWEEILFRKMIIDRMNRLGDRAAILTSALIFALIHGNFYQFFYAFAVGILFGYIYVRTGKIRWTILFHILLNLSFGVLPTAVYERFGTPALTVITAAEVIVTVLGLLLIFGESKKVRLLHGWVNLPKHRWGSIVFLNFGMILLLVLSALVFAVNIFL